MLHQDILRHLQRSNNKMVRVLHHEGAVGRHWSEFMADERERTKLAP